MRCNNESNVIFTCTSNICLGGNFPTGGGGTPPGGRVGDIGCPTGACGTGCHSVRGLGCEREVSESVHLYFE